MGREEGGKGRGGEGTGREGNRTTQNLVATPLSWHMNHYSGLYRYSIQYPTGPTSLITGLSLCLYIGPSRGAGRHTQADDAALAALLQLLQM